ncbi:hypothetical protein [Azospirillum sp. B506]|uniref:hypothetical protein n=1 Tax=Azospirillum sp. B506 TaxID=137721 RepID=UPI000344EDC3|nr:hypothetical protein [Azospirillum sp. B506]
MAAKRKARSWTGIRMAGHSSPSRPPDTSGDRPAKPQDRGARLVEALLEYTTIAGLFALLFALFVLFGAVHSLTP